MSTQNVGSSGRVVPNSESFTQVVARRSKENPFVPLGMSCLSHDLHPLCYYCLPFRLTVLSRCLKLITMHAVQVVLQPFLHS